MFQADGDELLTLVKELNSTQTGSAKVEQLDEALLKKLSYVAAGDLAPVNAFIGGLAAQEVMKVSLLPHNPVAFLYVGAETVEFVSSWQKVMYSLWSLSMTRFVP